MTYRAETSNFRNILTPILNICGLISFSSQPVDWFLGELKYVFWEAKKWNVVVFKLNLFGLRSSRDVQSRERKLPCKVRESMASWPPPVGCFVSYLFSNVAKPAPRARKQRQAINAARNANIHGTRPLDKTLIYVNICAR